MLVSRFFILLVAVFSLFIFVSSSLQIGESCSKDGDCGSGLECETCAANGNTRPRCSRIQPVIPTTKVKGLPFNKYSWLTTHNSYALTGMNSATGSILLAPTNQEDGVTAQLKNGARGLMLDMYDYMNDIWLCHSFQGKCYNFTAFQPAVIVLKEVQSFLDSNPSEIITIFIEDYVASQNGLTKVFNAAGLSKYMFPLSRIPKNGGNWPTVDDMVQRNQRLVVFTSIKSKETTEGIPYLWNYAVENQYGNPGMVKGKCPNRPESPAMNTSSVSLVLMNYFPTSSNSTKACADNSESLINMMNTCYEQDGKRWPNFIAVDYYKKSDGGGAAHAVDEANGQLTCHCQSIAYCQVNGNTTKCNAPRFAPPPPGSLPPPDPASNTTGLTADAQTNGRPVVLLSFCSFVAATVLLLV